MDVRDCCAPAHAGEHPVVAEAATDGGGPLVEILYFDGCPNHEGALDLVKRISAELGLQPSIRLVNVPDAAAAARLRFLGSPTVRVGGRDVEPGAEHRADFVLSCRVFRTERGFTGQPDERWIREALVHEPRAPA